MRIVLVALTCLLAGPTLAQHVVFDDFADGDFRSDPPWTGDVARFVVVPFGEGHALRSNGLARADTIALATASSVATGRWAFTFRHEANLSTANGARLYLVADTANLRGDVHGYYLQLGTNNLNRVELWRQDGPPGRRTRLGASPALLAGDANTVRLEVTRDEDGRWTVTADGTVVIADVTDRTYTASRALGLWVKHSSANGARFFLVDVMAETVDTRPPELLHAEAVGPAAVRAVFSEPLAACPPSAFTLDPGAHVPLEAVCDDGDTVALAFAAPLRGPAAYTLAARGLADRAGNVQPETRTTFFVGAFDVPEPGQVVIHEIMYAPEDHASNEYVEVLNRTADRTFDLAALRLANAASPPRPPLLAGPTPLPPGALAVLVRDPEAFAARFPGVPYVAVDRFAALRNDGDTVRLLHEDGTVLDEVPYRRAWGGQGPSLERRHAEGPSHAAANWASSPDPRGGTPGAPNAVAPDTTPPALLAAAPSPDGRAITLAFDEPLDPATVTPAAFALSDGPGHPLAVRLDGTGMEVELTWPEPPVPGFYTLRVHDVADWIGNRLQTTVPLLLGALDPPRPGDVVITEILFRPAEGGSEYIELHNRGPQPVDLRALTLAVGTTERPVSDEPAVLPPGGWLALARDAAALRARHGDAGSVLPMPRLPALPDAGAAVVVRHAGTTLDSVRYRPAWHRPELRDPRGVALERRDPALGAHVPGAWSSSLDPSGGTPGRPNSLTLAADAAPTGPGIRATPSPFDAEQGTVVRFALAAEAGVARVRVFDAGGRAVRTLEEGALVGRTQPGEVVWDGRDDAGRPLPVGIYMLVLEAVDLEGGRTEAYRAPVVLARR